MKFLTLILLSFGLQRVHAKSVPCARIEKLIYVGFGIDSPKTCFMDRETAIESIGLTISSEIDESIEGLRFVDNKKIHFLPEKIEASFPNLVYFAAYGCSIKEISKDNFQNLTKLTFLSLALNQIEKIFSDTFEDLTSLKYLFLCKEKGFKIFQFD